MKFLKYSIIVAILIVSTLAQDQKVITCRIRTTPSSGNSTTFNGTSSVSGDPCQTGCNPNANYGAVLYEGPEYSGIHHWVDSSPASNCRGLNGTSVESILILTGPGADPIYGAATKPYADGLSLTFYNQFGCAGNPVARLTGHKPLVCVNNGKDCLKPLSVKIECNGQGLFYNTTAKVPAPRFAVLTEQTDFQGIKHWIDGSVRECRGLQGNVSVASVQFVSKLGGDPVLDKADDGLSQTSRLVFFDDWGCTGNIIKTVIGNSPNTCTGTPDNCGTMAKSVMFMPKVYPYIPGSAKGDSSPTITFN